MDLALFHLDHTLIPFDSGYSWLTWLKDAGQLAEADYAPQSLAFARAYLDGGLDTTAFYRFVLSFLTRFDRADLEAWREDFIIEIGQRIPRGAHDLVALHREAGDLCCVVTATHDFVATAYARALGLEHLVATRPATRPVTRGSDGAADALPAYTGELAAPPCFGAGKVEQTRAWLATRGQHWEQFERTWFYSDSINDLPLLEQVSNPVAVSPDARLRALASERGWPILEAAGRHDGRHDRRHDGRHDEPRVERLPGATATGG